MTYDEFRRLIRQRGEETWRDMPWRQDTRPYYVLVSELMLQQTQVARVIPKFEAFIARFPDEKTLAMATLAEVLQLWQGLGYNRRAKFLHAAATMIVDECEGKFPTDEAALRRLPGVGKNTSGAIRAYAFNEPALYIETNIRTVYIHHFFDDRFDVDDKEIMALLQETIDYEHPRLFYQNLMDYGSWLKAHGVKNIAASKHYKKQSPLKGSIREVRGQIIRLLGRHDYTEEQLAHELNADERFRPALEGLIKDGLVVSTKSLLHLTR